LSPIRGHFSLPPIPATVCSIAPPVWVRPCSRRFPPPSFIVFFASSRLRVRFPSIRPLPHAKPRRPRRVGCMEHSSVPALTNETSRLPVLRGLAAFSSVRFPRRKQKQSRQASRPQKGRTETSGSKRSGRGLLTRPTVILSRPLRAFSTTLPRIPGAMPRAGLSRPVGAEEAKTGSPRHPLLPPYRLRVSQFASFVVQEPQIPEPGNGIWNHG